LRSCEILWRLLALTVLLVVLSGCGGTWIDDHRNFNRIFRFGKPGDVNVLHSYYRKSPHWSAEYVYFIARKAPPKFAGGLTADELMTSVAPGEAILNSCGDKRPPWFLPKPPTNYEVWIPKAAAGYRVFRDEADSTLFLCDQRL